MNGYDNITLEQALEIIKEQDSIIGRLTREVDFLKDSQFKRTQWLDKAKRDAGYPNSVSFDDVWEAALKSLKQEKNGL
jgi:hypothetical protein